jgi:GNAT superfamily N-acetyltransferase
VAESTVDGHARFIRPGPLARPVDTDEMLRAVIEFLRVWREEAPLKERTSWGTIYRDDRFPLIHEANLGWVATPPEDGPAKLVEDLAKAFGGTAVPHQAFLFEDAQEAFEVQEEFVRLGFRPTAELALAKVGLPDCIVNPELDVRAASSGKAADNFRSLMAAVEAGFGYSSEVIDQLWGVWRERSQRVGMRPYVAYLNGTPAGTISMWPRGIFAWIDNVGTHPDYRMRGVGRTMIFEACRRAIEARCEWVLLTSDLFDTPQEMYKTLGFEPIGEVRGFLRA